ncbi:MAG: Ig-like domain-containing protein [Verrucomicrobiaceae bacterium]|nr:Ig-like domain-containing protein [Verrucomicrobiaceae bacterium]
MKRPLLSLLTVLMTASGALADTTPHVLSGGSFSQNWSNAALITADDNWSGVPSITGYRGDDLTTSTGVNPQTVVAPSAVVDVVANQTTPNTNNSGAVAEFAIANPTIALQGSGTADAPYLSIFLNTTGVPAVTVSYKLRDIDGSTDNSQQQVALQYRIGSSGNFTDVTAGYVADATSGPSLATLETNMNVTLPGAVVGNALVEVRIITTNAVGNDEWVGIDDIVVSASDSIPPLATAFAPLDNAASVPVTSTPTITFNENVKKGTGSILIKRSSDNSTFESIDVTTSQVTVTGAAVTITPSANFANSTGYYIEIPAAAIEDIAGNDYAGISGATAWNFITIAASVLPSATETFTTGWRVLPTGSSTVTDYYAEGNGQGAFARFDLGIFNMTKLDFGLSGSSTITSVQSAEFTLTHNDRTFTQGTEVEFFFTTDAATGKTFDAAQVNGINNSQFTFAPISLGKFPYTPKAGGQTDVFTLDLAAAGPALVSRLNTGEDFSIIIAATTPMAAVTYSGKGNTFDPGDPSLKLTVNETTGVDTTAPAVAFFTPADGSGGLPISSNLRINFNEIVQKGTEGTITIFRSSDNSVFEAIPVTSTQVTVNLGTVTIDPAASLESAGSYYVQITAGAIEDTSGNDFTGIADTTTWNFSTAQPPITNLGPFSASQNAPAGTVVAQLNSNINGKEGIKYAMLGGSGSTAMMKAVPGSGYVVNPIFTIGDTINASTGALNPTSAGAFSPVGTLDGLGAFSLNANTVRVFSNHEIEIPNTGSAGYPYTLANGTVITKGGARISYWDIDKTTRRVVDGGLAIARMYDRTGTVVTSTAQLELGGLDRTCSSALFEPNLWGAGRGLVDRTYIMGEETSTAFGHPHGGTYWALDTSNGDLWALPDFGRGSWENAALVDTGTTTHVAFLLGDDAPARPLYLYVGEKSTAPGANFVERNGLKGGQLYVWKTTNGNTTPQQFNGTNATRTGTWVAVNARNIANAGTAGHDAQGYKNDTTLGTEASSLGCFLFSRPEDLSTSPTDGSIVAFTSTGRGSVYPLDNWGDTYILDIDFNGSAVPTAGNIRILYDGDDAGGGQFMSPEEGLRCPDNLDWADDGFIYVQEDQANQTGSFGAAGFETSIWKLNATTGAAVRITQTDRSTVLPLGSTDTNPGDVGNWESSGIIDVSSLFGEAPGELFLFDLQAHSVNNGLISTKQLYEGGQLCFLEKGIEKGAFKVNPNTGIITIANVDAIDMASQPSHELRLQAFDGTNHTLSQVTVNITNTSVATSNSFKVATYNISHYRATAGALITDLATVNATQSQNIARVIQRNNADVLLLNEFDYDAKGEALKRFQENYLEVGQSGEAPVYYPYAFIAPSNTGIASGFDLDNNGSVVTTPGAAGYGEDALGFGTFPGQYAFVVLSKHPIDTANIRTFQKFLWKDMPGALLPDDPDIAGTGDWYSPAELNVYRLSSKNHADVPVLVNGTPVHILASHPTPPVFDAPGAGLPWKAGVDHNGRRNSDEIRFWSDYVTPASSAYIYDDTETSSTPGGGLAPNSRFVLVGDQNADQDEGDSTPPAILSVINNVLFNGAFVPGGGAGPQPDDTAGFSGGVRVDYALPSIFGFDAPTGGVFWPGAGDPMSGAITASDHHLVFVNLTLNGVTLPPSTNLANYYAPAAGLTGTALQTALHNIIDDHVIIDYNTVDDVMRVIDEASGDSSSVRLLYSIANLPKTSTSWNREHVWPRSDGVGDEGADYSDIHHLFPAKDTVNSLRSNLVFDESANLDSDPFAPESFKDGDSWEPHDRDKGVVARALLYMMVRYDGSDVLTTDLMLSDSTGATGTHGVLSTLLAWHKAHPPTDYERNRNNLIYSGVSISGITRGQGNRNPFIDFPQFADALFLNSTTQSFNKWQVENFNFSQLQNSTLTGANGDADGDGRSNYAEYLLGGNPNAGTDEPLAAARTGNNLTLTFRRPKGITEQARIEVSSNLSSWTTVPGWETASVITDEGDYQRIDYTLTITLDGKFYRIVFE